MFGSLYFPFANDEVKCVRKPCLVLSLWITNCNKHPIMYIAPVSLPRHNIFWHITGKPFPASSVPHNARQTIDDILSSHTVTNEAHP